jgi:hypothetical protein
MVTNLPRKQRKAYQWSSPEQQAAARQRAVNLNERRQAGLSPLSNGRPKKKYPTPARTISIVEDRLRSYASSEDVHARTLARARHLEATVERVGLRDRAWAQELLIDAVEHFVDAGILPMMAEVARDGSITPFASRTGIGTKILMEQNPGINTHLHVFNKTDARRFTDGQLVRVLDLLASFPTRNRALREDLMDVVRRAGIAAFVDGERLEPEVGAVIKDAPHDELVEAVRRVLMDRPVSADVLLADERY